MHAMLLKIALMTACSRREDKVLLGTMAPLFSPRLTMQQQERERELHFWPIFLTRSLAGRPAWRRRIIEQLQPKESKNRQSCKIERHGNAGFGQRTGNFYFSLMIIRCLEIWSILRFWVRLTANCDPMWANSAFWPPHFRALRNKESVTRRPILSVEIQRAEKCLGGGERYELRARAEWGLETESRQCLRSFVRSFVRRCRLPSFQDESTKRSSILSRLNRRKRILTDMR